MVLKWISVTQESTTTERSAAQGFFLLEFLYGPCNGAIFYIHSQNMPTRTALQNAASVAGLMITTEAMVAEIPKEEASSGGGGGMGGMEGMM